MLFRFSGWLDPVTKGWATMSTGLVIRLAFGLVASVLLARHLGPAVFGVYAVLAAVSGITGAIADLGLSTTAVKRIAAVWQPASASSETPETPSMAERRWQTYAVLRTVSTCLVVAAGLLLARPLADRLLAADIGSSLLRLVFLGVLATALSGIMATALQSTRQFGRLSVVLVANSAMTAVLAVILAGLGKLTLVTALAVLGIGTSLLSLVLGFQLLPSGWRLGLPDASEIRYEGRELWRFGRWLWIASLLAMLAAQFDVLLLNRWSTAAVVGVYALALNLSGKVDIVNQGLHAVLLPAASALEHGQGIGRYLRRSLARSAAISAGVILLILLAGPLITLLYGAEYAAAVPLFQLLLLVVIFDVLTTPALLLAYPLNRPRLLALAEAVRTTVLVVLAVLLIPGYGPMGAIVARGVAKVVSAGLVLVALAWRRYRA